MAQSFNIDFKIIVGDLDEDWTSINQLLSERQYLVDYYLSIENLHCCDLQGGFFIEIDGQPWSEGGSVDEFWMTISWFKALKELLDGKEIANAHPWEESRLTLKRSGDTLELEDIHASGRISLPKVRVPLFEFVEQIVQESAKFSQLVNALREEIKSRRAAGVSEAVEVKLKEIEQNLPEKLEEDLQALASRLKTKTR